VGGFLKQFNVILVKIEIENYGYSTLVGDISGNGRGCVVYTQIHYAWHYVELA
jgi:hypothetical protein